MSIQLSFTSEQLNDLGVIADLGIPTINKVIEMISSFDPPPMMPSHLRKAINEVLDDDDKTNILIKQLISLCGAIKQRNISAEDIFTNLSSSISDPKSNWDKNKVEQWNKLEKTFITLLSLPAVEIVVKALDLTYDYSNIFKSGKIVTDIRPIFNDDASTINGSLVSFVLRLYYDSIEGNKSISIAVDNEDVKKLKESCERALKKAQTASEFMKNHDVQKTIICGEEI